MTRLIVGKVVIFGVNSKVDANTTFSITALSKQVVVFFLLVPVVFLGNEVQIFRSEDL